MELSGFDRPMEAAGATESSFIAARFALQGAGRR
jgi:hypothetical protein